MPSGGNCPFAMATVRCGDISSLMRHGTSGRLGGQGDTSVTASSPMSGPTRPARDRRWRSAGPSTSLGARSTILRGRGSAVGRHRSDRGVRALCQNGSSSCRPPGPKGAPTRLEAGVLLGIVGGQTSPLRIASPVSGRMPRGWGSGRLATMVEPASITG